jgi:hypothetical protein
MTPNKVGADDFVAAGATEEDLESLPRKEPRSEQAGPHDISQAGDDITLTFAQHGVTLSFGALRESSDGIHGELDVTSSVVGWMHWARLNLSSSTARRGLAKDLQARHPAPWPAILDHACRAVAFEIRRGTPVERLVPRRSTAPLHLLSMLIVDHESNVLFGDGGSAKSLLSLAMAVAVGLGVELPGGLRPARTVPTLYLDWETDKATHEDRLARVLEGLGVREEPPIHYRAMGMRALVDDAAFLRGEIARLGVGFVICDSFGAACGAEPESADAAIRTLNVFRSFSPAARLIIAHVSKIMAENRAGAARPYGSVYVQNLPRNVWEVRKSNEDGGEVRDLGLYHRKVNDWRLFPPFGLRLEFTDESVRLRSLDLGQAPDLLAGAKLPYKIQVALKSGRKDVPRLAEETNATPATITRTLRRLRKVGNVLSFEDGTWGLKA